VVPLGLVGFQLREGRAIEVRSEGVGQVIVDIAQIRAARSLSPVEETLGGSVTPDSTGR
jgi:hypothetical protein